MPTLYLMRHAQADNDSPSGLDMDRKLSNHGHEQAQMMARWLSQQAAIPQRIIASPAQRTRQTALAVAKAVGIAPLEIIWDVAIYSASAGSLLALIQEQLDTQQTPVEGLLLVGHNPALELLIRHFAQSGDNAARQQAARGMSPVSTAVIEWLDIQQDVPLSQQLLETGVLVQVAHA